jgi:hypothetical protein
MTNNIIIAILLAIIILLLATKPAYKGATVTVTTDTLYKDTVIKKWYKGDSIPYKVIDTFIVEAQKVDTAEILKRYFETKAYSDSLQIYAGNYVYINDTISQNKIIGRGYTAKISEKTVFVTKTVTPKDRSALYFGFMFDLRQDNRQLGVGVGGAFKTAKKGIITANATTNGYSLGYYLKF